MKSSIPAKLFGLLLALTLAAPLHAQAPTRTPSALAVSAENRTAMQAAARGAKRADSTVHAGDVLRYKLTFTNTAGRPVRQVALQNPVAAGPPVRRRLGERQPPGRARRVLGRSRRHVVDAPDGNRDGRRQDGAARDRAGTLHRRALGRGRLGVPRRHGHRPVRSAARRAVSSSLRPPHDLTHSLNS